MFYRKIEERINRYYADKNAKILVIDGARQIIRLTDFKRLKQKNYGRIQ